MTRICLVVVLLGLLDPSNIQANVGHVSGRVTVYNGSPVEGADVRFFLLDTLRGLPARETLIREVKTNHAGKYQARDLPVGSYRVSVELFGFGGSEVWRLYVWRAERWLDVGLAPGMTHDLKTATISGTVTSRQSGRPIADATVTLVSAYDVGGSLQARTDTNGRYTLQETLPPGDYVVWVAKEGLL